jgi:hypothetical protein
LSTDIIIPRLCRLSLRNEDPSNPETADPLRVRSADIPADLGPTKSCPGLSPP